MVGVVRPSKIIKYCDYAEIELCDIAGVIVGYAQIDLDDVNKVSKYRWCQAKCRDGCKYPVTSDYDNSYKRIYLHHMIIGKKVGFVVDHIDGNCLDNRKSNLRFVTISENRVNAKSKGGVHLVCDKGNWRWRVVIQKDKKKVYIGQTPFKKKAIQMAKQGYKKLYGNVMPQCYMR